LGGSKRALGSPSPGLNVRAMACAVAWKVAEIRVPVEVGYDPAREPIPRSKISRWVELPAQFFNQGVSLGGVAKHRRGNPVRFAVCPTSRNRDEVVNGWEQLPEPNVALTLLPIRMCRKVLWKQGCPSSIPG